MPVKDDNMTSVTLRLHIFESEKDANKIAEDIRSVGSLTYIDAEGDVVEVTVGKVTVESCEQAERPLGT